MKQYQVTITIVSETEVTEEEISKLNFGYWDKDVTDIHVEDITPEQE